MFFMHFYMMHITCAVMHIICDASVLVTQTQWRMDSSFHQHQFLMSIILWHFWTTFVQMSTFLFVPLKVIFISRVRVPAGKADGVFSFQSLPSGLSSTAPLLWVFQCSNENDDPATHFVQMFFHSNKMFFGLFQYKYWNIVT